jgi:hypothetical protein
MDCESCLQGLQEIAVNDTSGVQKGITSIQNEALATAPIFESGIASNV